MACLFYLLIAAIIAAIANLHKLTYLPIVKFTAIIAAKSIFCNCYIQKSPFLSIPWAKFHTKNTISGKCKNSNLRA